MRDLGQQARDPLDEHEEYLKRELYELHVSYQKAAEPLRRELARLVMLRCSRWPPVVYVELDA